MNKDELKQAVKDGYEKELGVWESMEPAQRELVIIVVMISVMLVMLTCWLIF